MPQMKIHAETPLTRRTTNMQCVHTHTHCARRGRHQGETRPFHTVAMQCESRQLNRSRHHNLLVMDRNYTVKKTTATATVHCTCVCEQSRRCFWSHRKRVCEQEGKRHVEGVFVSSIKHLMHLKYSSPHLHRDSGNGREGRMDEGGRTQAREGLSPWQLKVASYTTIFHLSLSSLCGLSHACMHVCTVWPLHHRAV